MRTNAPGSRGRWLALTGLCSGCLVFLAFGMALSAQSPSTTTPAQPAEVPTAGLSPAQPSATAEAPAITEDELRKRLAGQTLYLRGGYLDNSLHFDQNGSLASSSPQASYTLSLVEIEKVHLVKHKVELQGVRYGLHFVGDLATVDPVQAADKVRLTTKKKMLKITIDRETLVKPKKEKTAKKKGSLKKPSVAVQMLLNDAPDSAASKSEAEIDRHGATTTTSPAHANRVLTGALDNVFAHGMDEKMIAALPDYWKLYYRAASAKSDYKPADPSVLRQSGVDQKARLLTNFEAPSNEYAQTNGVAGLSLYHVVVSPEGKASEVAVARPIGFGLDENAVASIRKASFQPALKDGKPVPVLLDLTIQFRIYSKRTAVAANADSARVEPAGHPAAPSLPGPYSANQP